MSTRLSETSPLPNKMPGHPETDLLVAAGATIEEVIALAQRMESQRSMAIIIAQEARAKLTDFKAKRGISTAS